MSRRSGYSHARLTSKQTEAKSGWGKTCQGRTVSEEQGQGPGCPGLPCDAPPPLGPGTGPGGEGLSVFPKPSTAFRFSTGASTEGNHRRLCLPRTRVHTASSAKQSSRMYLKQGRGRRADLFVLRSRAFLSALGQDNKAGMCASRGSLLWRLHQ